jgi:hypothetical protein
LIAVHTGLSILAELADEIRDVDAPAADPRTADHWTSVDRLLQDWADSPGRRGQLRAHLRALPPAEADAVVTRSKEATTHFAWCLFDRTGDPFSLWLHEYKPSRKWLPGYANSVHNHRYHFCTTLLSGGYLHERFTADLDDDGTAIRSVTKQSGALCRAGGGGHLLSHEFHRIPVADDGTMTFLVKSRMVTPWSLSYDPGTGLSQRHIPMGNRLADLAGRI